MTDKTFKLDAPKKCSICNLTYAGWGNNAWPINEGRCCDLCNDLVIAARMRAMRRSAGWAGTKDH